jgi:hypothetical protein
MISPFLWIVTMYVYIQFKCLGCPYLLLSCACQQCVSYSSSEMKTGNVPQNHLCVIIMACPTNLKDSTNVTALYSFYVFCINSSINLHSMCFLSVFQDVLILFPLFLNIFLTFCIIFPCYHVGCALLYRYNPRFWLSTHEISMENKSKFGNYK